MSLLCSTAFLFISLNYQPHLWITAVTMALSCLRYGRALEEDIQNILQSLTVRNGYIEIHNTQLTSSKLNPN